MSEDVSWDGKERRHNQIDDMGWVKKGIIAVGAGLLIHFVVGIFAAAFFGGVVTTKLEYLKESIQEMKVSINHDRYTATEAEIDKKNYTEKIGRNERGIESNRDRIRYIERSVPNLGGKIQ